MSTQNITDPILLDSTGQQILSAIQDLTTAVQPTNVYVDIASTLSVSGWSSAVPSVYTWTNSKVTGECAVEVFFSTGAESAPTPYIEYEKGVGSVIFYAPTGKPTVNLPVVIRIINAEAEIASDIDADMVSTNAISGSSNVQEALTSVNSSLGTINSNINTLNAKIDTVDGKTSTAIAVIDGSTRAAILSNIDALVSGTGQAFFYLTPSIAEIAGLERQTYFCTLSCQSATVRAISAFRGGLADAITLQRTSGGWASNWLSLNSAVATKVTIKTTTISMDTESSSLRLDNKGIAFGRFICAFVRGTNNITCLPYSYSNAYYVKFVNTDTLQVVSGQYDVYILYWDFS